MGMSRTTREMLMLLIFIARCFFVMVVVISAVGMLNFIINDGQAVLHLGDSHRPQISRKGKNHRDNHGEFE